MGQILLRNALLWDGSGGEPLEGAQVLVEDDRIKEVSDGALKAGDAQVIDLGGRFLMPGLIDAHFHALAADPDIGRLDQMPRSLIYQHAREILEGALQRGYTTVRDAGGADYGLAMATETGLIKGPRLFYAGKALSQTGGHGDFRPYEMTNYCFCCQGGLSLSIVADGVTEVRRAAREELRKGATQIKIMASGGIASPSDPIWNLQYSEEEIRAVVWETQSWKTYVMAHVYTAEAIRRCLEYGVRSIEHGNLIDAETAVFAKEQGAFVVPTLSTYWAAQKFGRELGFPEVSLQKLGDVREAGLKALEILRNAGTKTAFGTDLLGKMHVHQLQEFIIRSEILGMKSTLLSATATNAELLNRSEDLGRIGAGALADMIVLESNPFEDLSAFEGEGKGVLLVLKNGEIAKNNL